MSAKLYDHSTKTWVEVPDDQVDSAVRSGNYTFEQGISIPSVAPTGELMDLDSSRAHEAFTKNDFRWATQADKNQSNADQAAAIRRDAANTPVAAAAAGALRTMTLGASDIVAPKLAETFSGGQVTEDEARQLSSDIKTENPVATTVGEIAGLIAPNPISAVGKVVKTSTQAANVVSRIAPKVLASAAEGATFGFDQGVSEAALGDRKEVLDNMISHIGTGALIGGALGGAFAGVETVSPFIKQKVSKIVEKTSDIVRSAMRSGAGSAGKAVLSLAGEKEAGLLFKDLASSPEAMRLIKEGAPGEAQRYVRDAEAAHANYLSQTKRAEGELVSKFKTLPKQAQAEVTQGLEAAGGDMRQALDDLAARTELASQRFDSAIAVPEYVGMPPAQLDALESRVQKLIGDLEKVPGTKTNSTVRELKDHLQAKFAKSDLSLSDEMAAFKDFRNISRQIESRPQVAEYAQKFRADLDDMVRSSKDENLTALYENVIRPQDGMDALHSAVSSTIKDANFKHLGSILASPEKFAAIRPMLENLADYAPELAKFQSKVGTFQERQAILKQAKDKISQSIGRSVDGNVSLGDMDEIFKLLTPKRGDIMSKLEDVRKASDILKSTEGVDPFSAAILFQRAMGKDVAAMEKLLPLRDKMAAFQRLQELDVQAPIGRTAATFIGGKIGGPIGAALANGATTAMTPVKAIQTLATIDGVASRGAALFAKASDRVIDSLTAAPAKRLTTVSAVKSLSPTERLQRFEKIAKVLPRMQDPDYMANSLADATAGVQGMPALKLEIQSRLATAAGFLQSKIPQDTTLAVSPFGSSKWTPSNQEFETFMRYVNAVDQPLQVIDKIADGTVTPEETEALKVVHPDLFARLQRRVMDGILDKGSEVPYQAKLTLSAIFDIPTDYTLQPEFIAEMQNLFADQDQGAQASQQTKRPKSKLKLDPMTAVATEATKVSEGKYGDS
jgi:hypothetical protein